MGVLKNLKSDFNVLRRAIFAGIAISIGGIAFMTMGNPLGPILFSFGLLTVIHYKLALYTGAVGFTELIGFDKNILYNWKTIMIIILGNVIGCLTVAYLVNLGNFAFLIEPSSIVASRLAQDTLSVIVRGIGCGLIMSTAVQFAREGRFLPLLFGVPLFIFCGFYHSIADTFYYLASTLKPTSEMLITLAWTYLGNYIGCSTYKMFVK